mmetsp:Transcript_64818/g.118296  ORF Transcript_64818/g.118296 Transcript_64818/m.118296 type:complete len:175 (-) Transcript_64818:101-625(-)
MIVQLAFSEKLFNKKYWGSMVGMDVNDTIKPCEGDHTADRFEYMSISMDVIILIGVALLIGMKTANHPGFTMLALAFFWCFNIGIVCADLYLMSKASEAGNQQDRATIRKNMLKAIVKAIVFFSLHHWLGLLSCLITGVISSIIHMPVWSAYDHSMWEKYTRNTYHGTRNLLQS